MIFGLVFIAGLLPSSCANGDDDDVRFNADDTIEVSITASTDLGEAVTADLHSTTGAVVIGTVTVDPGSGPVGTDHVVTVLVDDEFADEVDRADVLTDAGDRGIEEHSMVQDSAETGLWVRTLTSVGETGEARTDTFTIELWTPDDGSSSDTDE